MSSEIPRISKIINSNNYFLNSYRLLTRSKTIHFISILIEIIINIFQEIEIFYRDYRIDNIEKKIWGFNIVSILNNIFDNLKSSIKLFIIMIYAISIDTLYFFFGRKNYKIKHIKNMIIINILDIFCFRTVMLIFLNFFFLLSRESSLIGGIFTVIHIFLTANNFLYNHLFHFVPDFINYPYDEFSSSFDIILLIIKVILSAAGTTKNPLFGKFLFGILFTLQIFFSFYFICKLKNHSYLFMKNSFLNRTKICLFFTQSIVILLAFFLGKRAIKTVLFLIIEISALLIMMSFIYFIYNPFYYIKINSDTSLDNIVFYLYILSEKNDYDFLYENKINEHYKNCGFCFLCKKYNNYRVKYKQEFVDDEKEKLLNSKRDKINERTNNNQKDINDNLIELFDIINDGRIKYFNLIKKLILNYKNRGKESLKNNSYYYINLSFLIYSDYKQKNISLSLNERILLEVLYKENSSFLDNYEFQINQLLLCNKFVTLSTQILNLLKEILNYDSNLNKTKKFIELSRLLKEMKDPKYIKNLFCHKSENVTNSKHLLLTCSIIYEEIFNVTLNNSQMPIRDNLQPIEDIFHIGMNKNNNIISLSLNLTNKNCKILRAGKGLYSYINNNLFDLFPLIFKQYQTNLFLSCILENFESNIKKRNNININRTSTFNRKDKKSSQRSSIKIMNNYLKSMSNNNTNINKKDFVEIKVILSQNIASKMYYKLLSLKLTLLFNSDNYYFILFDGVYYLHKHTLITLQDLEENSNSIEKLIAVSEPELEKYTNLYSISFKKYVQVKNSQGFNITKIFSINTSMKYYNIYILSKRERLSLQKKLRQMMTSKKLRITDEEEEEHNSSNKNNQIEKIKLMEDNASTSQGKSSSHSAGITNLGIRNKKRDNIFEYGGFNKIKRINYFIIFILIVAVILEYIFYKNLLNDINDKFYSYINFHDFAKLYFQLFSSIIGVSCISYNNKCYILTNIFTEQYFKENPSKEFFNYTIISQIQNEILSKLLLERRNNLVDIHKSIGNKEYNALFGKKINFLRISQNLIQGKMNFSLIELNIQFSEALLIMCNSFQALTNISQNPIYLLNKTDDPFSLLNKYNNHTINDFQREFYELIINFKQYYKEFHFTNIRLRDLLFIKSNYITILLFVFVFFNNLLNLLIGILMHIYMLCYENILIKIMNYVNMVINSKNDDFIFNNVFTEKLNNLRTILEFYNEDPLKAIKNLNEIYQQFLSSKIRNISNDINKKKFKNSEENKKNELDNIPKNQRIFSKKDLRNLGITFIFLFFLYIYFIFCIYAFCVFIIFWYNAIAEKNTYYDLMEKNIDLEYSLYRAINVYGLMIFHNYTIEEVSKFIFKDYEENKNHLLNSFYDDLKLAFDSKKEKSKISKIFQDFEDQTNFTCEKLFEYNYNNIQLEKENPKAKNLNNIEKNLIDICEDSKISQTNDFRTVYERHFQYIKNGILSISDYTYDGLIEHIIGKGTIAKISLFFNVIIIHILEVANTTPHRNGINNLLRRFGKVILFSECFCVFIIFIIIIFTTFFFSGINNKCNQIILLKQIFKIVEIQEI